ncbi:HD domain-containing protein [Photobacterium damselae]|uniref:HD domain-containing protein n=1 Tax=Photobacterium damselae TaxID=38293 RepID=UPI001F1E7188|nr:HD domain-containing protein [Photobacterium damselae]UKA04960.1 hypothetical protein IHC89_22200 [Photobacterium damselae subsp. damselae]
MKSRYHNTFDKDIIVKITALAALLHDIGKATTTFQAKLTDDDLIGLDVMRHERLSAALLYSLYCVMVDKDLIGNCDDYGFFNAIATLDVAQFKEIINEAMSSDALKHAYSQTSQEAIQNLSSELIHNSDENNVTIFNSVFLLILSHHHMPLHNNNDISEKGFVHERNSHNDVAWYDHTAFSDDEYIARVQQECRDLVKFDFSAVYKNVEAFISAILYIARPALVLADQNVSANSVDEAKLSKEDNSHDVAYANSYISKDSTKHLAQPLTDHLLKVSVSAESYCEFMINDLLDTTLPSLKVSPDSLTSYTDISKFKWQNTALDVAINLKDSGNLVLISAETGLGKTRANAKVSSALRDHSGLRLTTLLGMNTLTKQTATEYINDMDLGNSACAITGHAITRYEINKSLDLSASQSEIDEHQKMLASHEKLCANGTESLVGTDDISISDYSNNESYFLDVRFKCSFKPKYNQILATPLVVSTIDHIIECIQSGSSTSTRLIQRIQTSDIIIDEIDSYSAKSLVAINKLVYLAGLFNRNIIVSSATLRPAAAKQLIETFNRGIEHNNFIFNKSEEMSGAVISNHANTTFAAHSKEEFYEIIEKQRVNTLHSLSIADIKRRLEYVSASNAKDVYELSKQLHKAHHVNIGEFKFSAGVIRFNNVKYVKAFARALSKISDKDTEISVISYHSRLAAPVRYAVERCLDTVLKRKDHDEFSKAITECRETKPLFERAVGKKNVMFLVVCSPIEETGRDHDFDWGITEPCKHHSLIQLAGRIRRHRGCVDLSTPNMYMLNKALKTQYEANRHFYSMTPAWKIKLQLSSRIDTPNAFSELDIDYTKAINAKVCLTDYDMEYVEKAEFDNINKIEVQEIYNATHNLFDFIDNAHTRISESHAIKFPLRDKNTDTACWYNGNDWLIPRYSFTTNEDDESKTEVCNWKYSKEKLTNLLFNEDIDTVISSINADEELMKLLLSKHSGFGLTKKEVENLSRLYFSTGLGLLDLNDEALNNI